MTAMRRDNRLVLDLVEQDKELVLVRACLAKAIELSQEKHEYIAECMGVSGSPYLHKMLDGDKPISFTHVARLPQPVKRRFALLYAEANGLIVIDAVEGELAVRNILSGIAGILSPKLPARAERMAHIGVSAQGKAVNS